MARIRENVNQDTEQFFDSEGYEQRRVDFLNFQSGNLGGHDCGVCKNKGYLFALDKNNCFYCYDCECMPIRRSYWNLQKSGLSDAIEQYTFDGYKTVFPWQENAKTTAQRYLDERENDWFFIGGQPGAGKTHLCTAICGQLLKSGVEVRYMLWLDEIRHITACFTDDDEYQSAVYPLKRVEVLYIDDLFKLGNEERGRMKKPSPAMISVTHEIINSRYIAQKPTIISTQISIDDILDIDEALGSRIYERSKRFCVLFPKNAKNWRLT